LYLLILRLRGAWRDVVAELLQRRFSGSDALKASMLARPIFGE
jgi:hypothetical protein